MRPEGLKALLCPRSVTVVGASKRPNSFGRRLLKNLAGVGSPGEVYPINPRLDAIDGARCYPSLADLRRVAHYAVLAVSNRHDLKVLDEAVGTGVASAVVFDGPIVEPDPRLHHRTAATVVASTG